MDTILSALSKNQEKTVNEPVEVGKNIWTDEVVDTRKWILKVRKVLILFIINYFWWEMWKLVWGKQNGKEIQNPNIPSIGPLNEAGKTIKSNLWISFNWGVFVLIRGHLLLCHLKYVYIWGAIF